MDIETSEPRYIKHFLGQNLAEGRHKNEVRFEPSQAFHLFGIAQLERLEYLNTVLQRNLLYRRRLQRPTSSGRLIRLCVDRNHLILAVEQVFQRRNTELRRAHENDAHINLFSDCYFIICRTSSQPMQSNKAGARRAMPLTNPSKACIF